MKDKRPVIDVPDITKIDEETAVKILMEAHGYDEPDARFHLELLRGGPGDVIDLGLKRRGRR